MMFNLINIFRENVRHLQLFLGRLPEPKDYLNYGILSAQAQVILT